MDDEKPMKPFMEPGFTMFNNAILDHIMPRLSPNAWKVLCVALRQTWGWEDKTTESGRREEDEISYTQFLEKTGIGSKTTLSRAINECLNKGYLKRYKIGSRPGIKSPIYAYSLNIDYELEISTETVPMESALGTESVPDFSTETVPMESALGTESVPTKSSIGTETVLTKESKKEIRSKRKGNKVVSAQSAENKSSPKPEKSSLLPDTTASRKMFGRLQANAKANGRRGPSRFKTLECKQKFDEAVANLSEQEFERALTKALEQGITSVVGVTNYVAAWANNNNQRRSGVSHETCQRSSAKSDPSYRIATPEQAAPIVAAVKAREARLRGESG